jgi:hypothetical protein
MVLTVAVPIRILAVLHAAGGVPARGSINRHAHSGGLVVDDGKIPTGIPEEQNGWWIGHDHK